MKRILIVSDSMALHTGFGNIARKLLMHLHQTGKYKLAQLAWFHKETDVCLPKDIEIYPTAKEDFFGAGMFEIVVTDFKPDIVLTISDLFMVHYIESALVRKTFKWIGYVPIDGKPLLPNVVYNIINANVAVNIKSVLNNIDHLISYSDFGKQVVDESGFAEVSEVIHCGVDTEIFKPISHHQKGGAKRGLLGLSEYSFVVGFVGRNSLRKRPDRLLKAFAKFSKNKDNVYLYMHCALQDFTGFQLAALAKEYGIDDKVAFNGQLIVGQGFSDNLLAMYYNALDVLVIPTSSEGFCLPLLEAMSCGVPTLATNYSAHVEWNKAGGKLIPVQEFLREPRTNMKRALIDIDALAEGMEELYSDELERKRLGKAGREKALTMDWKLILVQWEKLIDSIEPPIEVEERKISKIDTSKKVELTEL